MALGSQFEEIGELTEEDFQRDKKKSLSILSKTENAILCYFQRKSRKTGKGLQLPEWS